MFLFTSLAVQDGGLKSCCWHVAFIYSWKGHHINANIVSFFPWQQADSFDTQRDSLCCHWMTFFRPNTKQKNNNNSRTPLRFSPPQTWLNRFTCRVCCLATSSTLFTCSKSRTSAPPTSHRRCHATAAVLWLERKLMTMTSCWPRPLLNHSWR